jgi:hypothetical protein
MESATKLEDIIRYTVGLEDRSKETYKMNDPENRIEI